MIGAGKRGGMLGRGNEAFEEENESKIEGSIGNKNGSSCKVILPRLIMILEEEEEGSRKRVAEARLEALDRLRLTE